MVLLVVCDTNVWNLVSHPRSN